MAIDSRDKRASCLAYARPNRTRVWPNPSGSLASQGQRQHLAYLYAGVLTPAVVTMFNGLTTSMRLTGVGAG